MFPFWMRGPLRDKAGDGTAGGGAAGAGDDGKPQYVTAEDFGKTAAYIRNLGKTIETLAASALTADKLVDIGLVEKTEDGKYKPRVAAAPEPKPKPSGDTRRPEDDPLYKELQDVKASLKQSKEEVQRERTARENLDLEHAVRDALAKAGAKNAGRDFVHIKGEVLRGDQGYYAKGKDQYGNDIDVPLEQFATKWLESNPELRNPQAKEGSGTPASKGMTAEGKKIIPYETWSNMAWYAENRQKFITGEYVKAPRA